MATLGQRLKAIAEEHQRVSSSSSGAQASLSENLQRIWLLGPKRCGPNFLLLPPPPPGISIVNNTKMAVVGSGNAATAAAPSLFEVPPQQVVKMAKQHPGRAPSAASWVPLTSAGDADSTGQETGATESHIVHVNLQLGTPLVSQRLGLVNSTCENEEEAEKTVVEPPQEIIMNGAGDVQAAAEHLARHLDALTFSNGDAQDNTNNSTESRSSTNSELAKYVQHSVQAGVVAGFEMATAAGPLCDEPMWGLSFHIEARLNLNPTSSVSTEKHKSEVLQLLEDVYGPFSGQVTSATRQAVRKAVLEAGPRLAEAAFLCEVTTSSEGLSAVYAVLGRRRSRVLREEMREGSDLFTIHAYLPAEASFGFADELRRRSSGAASASLMLSHWERLGVDPFFVPLTEEEREEFGEEGQGVGVPNLAKRLIDSVRKRKGLAVEQKVVESATRQRTLARKV